MSQNLSDLKVRHTFRSLWNCTSLAFIWNKKLKISTPKCYKILKSQKTVISAKKSYEKKKGPLRCFFPDVLSKWREGQPLLWHQKHEQNVKKYLPPNLTWPNNKSINSYIYIYKTFTLCSVQSLYLDSIRIENICFLQPLKANSSCNFYSCENLSVPSKSVAFITQNWLLLRTRLFSTLPHPAETTAKGAPGIP